MSNILPEDVKSMAEFMGVSEMCPRCLGSGRVMLKYTDTSCSYCGGVKYQGTPDYPKDMTALLGVMKKLDDDHNVVTDISGEHGSVVVWQIGNLSPVLAEETFATYTDLPTVLCPLLVEAIKQIKESE